MGAQFGREKFTTQLERRRVCQALQGTLEMVGARQLVIGHTPQACTQAPLPVLCELLFRPHIMPAARGLGGACVPVGTML